MRSSAWGTKTETSCGKTDVNHRLIDMLSAPKDTQTSSSVTGVNRGSFSGGGSTDAEGAADDTTRPLI